ncbi:hypothetical protein A5893_06505 [Pedobacter psychrophilus]|uniref:Type 1 periplasmic binding fold superfamily protein n=1 Tax=Pedobacter psychrophilus TaxID=1826909 RepID=A0A179DHT7_9SPHI|nr:hypothetical protein [Pedobacter psychrophilus]OAQ40591.1 hypothetical protein A5893_06505 [Pedobacter psychrophilus]
MMYKNKLKFLILAVAVGTMTFQGCKKDDLPDVDDNELITTIRLKFVNNANSNDIKLVTWKDLDGDGGKAPVIDVLALKPSSVYSVSVDALLDESKTPILDVRADVLAENFDHLFVYAPSTGLNLTFSNFDKDKNNLAVGLTATGTTAAASSGTLKITLRHQLVQKMEALHQEVQI